MLDDYLQAAAEQLRAGRAVYLCPAAMETVLIARMLRREYGVNPSGFCDNDAKKQGKHLNSLPELHIFSFDEVLRDETARFLIVSPHHSAAIMGDLVYGRGVSEERILNFQPVEWRKTCPQFAHNWIIQDGGFVCCCIEDTAIEKPRFDNKLPDPRAGVEYIDRIRKGLIDETLPLPEACRGCYSNRSGYIYRSRKLNSFNFSFRGWCNYKCAYCSANRPELKNYNDRFCLEPYLAELERLDIVNGVFSVLFAVGEPCLNEKRFPLYAHCGEKRYFLDVFSNCSVFDPSLFELARRSPVIIRKSFDAGTAETYAEIKGVSAFERVLENVGRYLQAPYLALNPKYLFVPGINDNETDIERFVDRCAAWHVDFVTPVFSILDDSFRHSDHAREMFRYLLDRLAERHIFTANVDTLYSEAYHRLYREAFR